MNITETISLLDELRGKLNNGLIGDEFDDAVWEFVKAYDTTLRQAALDGERYRKAGEALAEALASLYLDNVKTEQVRSNLEADVHTMLGNYRQAVEQRPE